MQNLNTLFLNHECFNIPTNEINYNHFFEPFDNEEILHLLEGDCNQFQGTQEEDHQFTITNSNWTKEEDQLLSKLCEDKKRNWKAIANNFKNKTARQCAYRFDNHLNPNFKRFNRLDDLKLLRLIEQNPNDWEKVHREMPEFSITQLYNRYIKFLQPKIFKSFNKKSKIDDDSFKQNLHNGDNNLDSEKKQIELINRETLREKIKTLIGSSKKLRPIFDLLSLIKESKFKNGNNEKVVSLQIRINKYQKYLFNLLNIYTNNLSKSSYNYSDVNHLIEIESHLIYLGKLITLMLKRL